MQRLPNGKKSMHIYLWNGTVILGWNKLQVRHRFIIIGGRKFSLNISLDGTRMGLELEFMVVLHRSLTTTVYFSYLPKLKKWNRNKVVFVANIFWIFHGEKNVSSIYVLFRASNLQDVIFQCCFCAKDNLVRWSPL